MTARSSATDRSSPTICDLGQLFDGRHLSRTGATIVLMGNNNDNNAPAPLPIGLAVAAFLFPERARWGATVHCSGGRVNTCLRVAAPHKVIVVMTRISNAYALSEISPIPPAINAITPSTAAILR
jgi:hypothetical protein